MSTIKKYCLYCKKPFNVSIHEVNRGFGKFCSLTCSNTYNTTKRFAMINKPNVTCAHCGKKFYKAKSRFRLSKHKFYFCCRDHKDKAQRIGGIKAIQPPHYNNHSVTYRTFAFRNLPIKCCRCGFHEHREFLQVHHKDGNRSNNNLSNLQILCVLCHFLKHIETKIGKKAVEKFLQHGLAVIHKHTPRYLTHC